MRTISFAVRIVLLGLFAVRLSTVGAENADKKSATQPAPLNMQKARAEVEMYYTNAHPEIREYILYTAESFGKSALWLNEDAFVSLPQEAREKKIRYLATLLEESEYGRHLCAGLAEASALKDKRLVPGLLKVAGYYRDDVDYDCRAKWMAVAALARQESDDAVPVLVSLVDHGNQNTRKWARAALARKTGQDFAEDKQAWAKWWQEHGHDAISPELLKPSKKPANKN